LDWRERVLLALALACVCFGWLVIVILSEREERRVNREKRECNQKNSSIPTWNCEEMVPFGRTHIICLSMFILFIVSSFVRNFGTISQVKGTWSYLPFLQKNVAWINFGNALPERVLLQIHQLVLHNCSKRDEFHFYLLNFLVIIN
jgi:hypothetical protein